MPKTTKRPALRFAGFSGEWEERKLGDIGKARSGVGFPDVEQGGTEGIPFYKVSDMNLVGNEIEMTRSNNYVTNEQIEKKRWNPVDDVPAIFFAKVGAAVMLNRKRLCRFPFLLDNNTMAYSLYNDYWNMEFAKAAFTKIDFTKLIQVGALPSYNSGDVEDIRVMLPPMKEQNKIGQYFAHLDHLIALHERKYSKLMNVKKFMLEKMFPKDGAKVPALRFAGFSSEWEERKLEEIGTIVTGSTPSTDISEYYSSDGIPWVTPTDILENITYNTTKKLSDKGQKVGRIVPPNSILVTCIASIGKNTMLGTVGSCNQQINAIIPNTHEYFPYFLLTESHLWSACMKKSAAAGIMQIVNQKEFSDQKTMVPKLREQTQIGTFFATLDHLLSLHRQELERLQNVKKSCLEKMFA